jgi:tyrosine decarboxylase/aspartate 1-decarboxylase
MNKKNFSNILKEFQKYREKDFSFSSGKILGSMCTQPHPIAKKIYMNFLETNLGDPDLFPGSKEIELKYTDFLLKICSAPNNASGIIGSGGTENNLNAVWLAKKISNKKEVIIPANAHFSFEKIASLMDVKLVEIPLTNKYFMDVTKVKKEISKNTVCIVGIAGSTELGTIDPIPDLSDICIDENIFLHVDAAFGGFVIPFLKQLDYDINNFDFSLKGVSSISIDAHKMGCSAIPLGVLLVRDKKWLDKISVKTPYLNTMTQAGLLATRSGGPVAAAYAVSRHLGFEGYKKLVKKCMDVTEYARMKIEEIGLKLVINPTMNILGVKVKNPERLVKLLTHKGWKVNKMQRLSAVRIVIMPHVTKKTIDLFIPDLNKACKKAGEL